MDLSLRCIIKKRQWIKGPFHAEVCHKKVLHSGKGIRICNDSSYAGESLILKMGNTKPIRNVLLIDDDIDDHLFFEEAVKLVDNSISVAYISSMNNMEKKNCVIPDLVFLDINMPDKNGFEWLSLIRKKYTGLPVIMYSTASNPGYVERAYTEGAQLYFPKPDSFQQLIQSLVKLFSLDWADPQKITTEFCSNGKYKVFKIEA